MKFRLDIRRVKAAVFLAAALVLLLAGMLLLRAWEEGPSGPEPSPGGTPSKRELTSFNGAWYARRENLETFLLLGVDKAVEDESISTHGSFEQSDFLMLLVLDHESGRCIPIHLNRDTMTQINQLDANGKVTGTFTGQLTLAHASAMDYTGSAEQGCKSAAASVSNLLFGVEVDHYLSLSLDGVPVLNDLAGGVTVELLDDFTWLDPAMAKGETVTLRGSQALSYVRARKETKDQTNLGRMERQRQYLEALRFQLSDRVAEDESFILDALLAISNYIVSDCTVEKLADLAQAAQSYAMDGFVVLPGEMQEANGHMEFHTDDAALQELVIDIFYEPAEEPGPAE